MEELRIGFYGLLIANIVLGFLFGTFPLVAGLLAGNRKYALLGFIVSIAAGAILGVFLSYPLAMLFVWLIHRGSTANIGIAARDEQDAEPA